MTTEQRTHLGISETYVGAATELAEGYAKATLASIPEMAADDRGLVHGGFTFGLADYAAMLAVNDPHVVLGAAQTRFLAPVRVGETMVAEARVTASEGKKRTVQVEVSTDRKVFEGEFTCFVLKSHVLG
jgi:acyl-coenzyme A thioesterase PaaI-like protein